MRITFLLLEAFTIDGTVRTTFTLADELSRRHDVEIVSVRRTADRPVFPLSDRVRLRSWSTSVRRPRSGGRTPGGRNG